MGNGGLSQRLRRDPLPHLRALEAACHEIAMEARPGYDKNGTDNTCVVYFIVSSLFLCVSLGVIRFLLIR